MKYLFTGWKGCRKKGLVVGLLVGLIIGTAMGAWAGKVVSKTPIPFKQKELLFSGRRFIESDEVTQSAYIIGAYDMVKTIFLYSKTPDGGKEARENVELIGNIARGEKDPFPKEGKPAKWLVELGKKPYWPEMKQTVAFGVNGELVNGAFSVIERITVGQWKNEVVKYIQEHPEANDLGAAYLVWVAATNLNTDWLLAPAR